MNELNKYLDDYKKQIEKCTKSFWAKINAKKDFEEKEFDIIINTDFDNIYGRNNEKIRKAHIMNELKEEYELMKQTECEHLENERMCDYYKYRLKGFIK